MPEREYSWREIVEWLERLDRRVQEAATQSTTAATEAREAKNHAARINGRLSKIEDWKHEMELWFAKQMARTEAEASMLLSRRQGKAIWTLVAMAGATATLGAAVVAIINGVT